MFINNYPKFERDIILKAEMLENIKQYPRDMFHLFYQDYSDGIICGARILIEEGRTLVITPGIIKYQGVLYHLRKQEKVVSEPLGVEQILVVRFLDREEHVNDILYPTETILKQDNKPAENELELCRFILKEGAVLRKDYQDLRDMATLHNTINIIEVPYAGKDAATLSPEITYCFGSEMLKYRLSDPYDAAFVMECMQKNVMQRELIEQYVHYRVPNAERGQLTQKQLHHYLTVIVDAAKHGGNRNGRMQGGNRRMLVD